MSIRSVLVVGLIGPIIAAVSVAGCSAAPAAPALPNPAVVKCLEDGWRTEPLSVNGIPTGTVCIEPASGRRCEAWSHFRHECPDPLPETVPGAAENPGQGGPRQKDQPG